MVGYMKPQQKKEESERIGEREIRSSLLIFDLKNEKAGSCRILHIFIHHFKWMQRQSYFIDWIVYIEML